MKCPLKLIETRRQKENKRKEKITCKLPLTFSFVQLGLHNLYGTSSKAVKLK
jgi:hypothetical protein